MDHLLLVFLVFSLQNVSFLSLVLDFQGYIHYVKMYNTHYFTFFFMYIINGLQIYTQHDISASSGR